MTRLSTFQKRKFVSILLTIINCIVIFLLLAASAVLLIVPKQNNDKFEFAGYQIYLIQKTIDTQHKQSTLLITSDDKTTLSIGDTILLNLNQANTPSYFYSTITQLQEGSVVVFGPDDQQNMIVPKENIVGKVLFSNSFLGQIIGFISAPENRTIVIAILCVGFSLCAVFIGLVAIRSNKRKQESEEIDETSTLYQIQQIFLNSDSDEDCEKSSETPPETTSLPEITFDKKSPDVELSAEELAQQIITQRHPNLEEIQKYSNTSQKTNAERLVEQIIQEDNIDLNKIEITLTKEKLEKFERDILHKT